MISTKLIPTLAIIATGALLAPIANAQTTPQPQATTPPATPAQSSAQAAMNRTMQISQARQNNAALFHQYQWDSRTEVIESDTIKDIRIEQLNYGLDSKLQRVLLNDTPTLPGGFLRRMLAENEQKKTEKYLVGLRGLLEQYTLPTNGKILDFISSAKMTGPDADGTVTYTGQNVVVQGDTLTLIINNWTKQTREIRVNTTFDGDYVVLTSTYAALADSGLNYPQFSQAQIPPKNLSVQVQYYDFTRLAR